MKTTQAESLVRALRTRWMSWGEVLQLRISTSPWKRLSEAGHKYMRPDERIEKVQGVDGLLRVRVVKA